MSDLALISPDELSLVEDNSLNARQLKLILQRTPEKYVKQRPAKGGGTWDYVTGGYVKKCLNLMFGFDWDFEILDEKILYGEAIVKGRLTCRTNGKTIVKTQFGNKDIMYKKLQQGETERQPLSIGNDLKAAATDCLKKCAAEIGIAADIYNKEDFREIKVDTTEITLAELSELYEAKKEAMNEITRANAERILKNNETKSFSKLQKQLSEL